MVNTGPSKERVLIPVFFHFALVVMLLISAFKINNQDFLPWFTIQEFTLQTGLLVFILLPYTVYGKYNIPYIVFNYKNYKKSSILLQEGIGKTDDELKELIIEKLVYKFRTYAGVFNVFINVLMFFTIGYLIIKAGVLTDETELESIWISYVVIIVSYYTLRSASYLFCGNVESDLRNASKSYNNWSY